MNYQAVVIIWMLGTPSPIQVDESNLSNSLSNCYERSALMLREIIYSAPSPVISAQGFCLVNPALKKKDQMQTLQDSKKENSSEPTI